MSSATNSSVSPESVPSPPTPAEVITPKDGATAATRPPGDRVGTFAPLSLTEKDTGSRFDTTTKGKVEEVTAPDTLRRVAGSEESLSFVSKACHLGWSHARIRLQCHHPQCAYCGTWVVAKDIALTTELAGLVALGQLGDFTTPRHRHRSAKSWGRTVVLRLFAAGVKVLQLQRRREPKRILQTTGEAT